MPSRQIESTARCMMLAAFAAFAPVAATGQGAPGPVPVTVVTLKAQDVTLSTELPGRVVSYGVAEVRPQVTGIIVERLFEEGRAVDEGDPMYRIDAASYEAQVQQSEASVAQARATLTAAEKEETRNEELLARNVASQQALDDAVAARDSARAALLVAKAQLRADQINLEHTTIRAPLSGVVGRALTTRGALVTAQQADPLAVINQIDRVYVDVTASAAEMVRRQRAALFAGRDMREIDPVVTLTLADGLSYDRSGTMRAADWQVDTQTGVTVLRLEFPNPNQLLLPGMYVKAHMPVEVVENAVLAPQEGVSRDRRGQPTALVVTDNNTVETRVLKVLGTRDGNWIVSDGLSDGDRIIVAGLQKVGPGSEVIAEEAKVASIEPAQN